MDDEAFDDLETGADGQDVVITTNPGTATVYSTHALRVLQTAASMAAMAPGGILTCEHLLLALASESDSVACAALADCGFDASNLRLSIAFIRGDHAECAPAETIVHSPRVERVLALARQEAGTQHRDRIETLHLLIGIVREGRGIAALALESPGVGHERLETAISHAIRNGVTDPS